MPRYTDGSRGCVRTSCASTAGSQDKIVPIPIGMVGMQPSAFLEKKQILLLTGLGRRGKMRWQQIVNVSTSVDMYFVGRGDAGKAI